LEIKQINRLLLDGVNIIREEKIWDIYTHMIVFMNKDNYVSFEELLEKNNQQEDNNKEKISDEKLIEMAEKIRIKHQGGVK
jgi:hypothetical protein